MRLLVPLAAALCVLASGCGDGGAGSTASPVATSVAPSPTSGLSPIGTSVAPSPTSDLSAELAGTPCGPPVLNTDRSAIGGPRVVAREVAVCIGQVVHVGVRSWPTDEDVYMYFVPPPGIPGLPATRTVEDDISIGSTRTVNGLADVEFLLEKQYKTQSGQGVTVRSGQEFYVAARAAGSGTRASYGPITVR